MQLLTVTGNLGGDVEEKNVGGQTVREFSLAANKKMKGEDVTTWYRVALWGDFYKGVAPYLTKGSKVLVTGDLNFRTYKKQSGEEGYSLDVRADKVELIGAPAGKKEEAPAQEQKKTGNPFLDA